MASWRLLTSLSNGALQQGGGGGGGVMAAAAVADTPLQGRAQELFDEFVSASTCRAALWSFNQLCDHLQLDRSAGAERPLYRPIRSRLNYWKADALWRKLERRASQQEYQRGRGACSTTTVRMASTRQKIPPSPAAD